MSSALLVMSADYEMLVSRSPPSYSHSPPAGFLIDYCNTSAFAVTNKPPATAARIINASNNHLKAQKFKTSPAFTTRSASCTQINSQLLQQTSENTQPRRPCLVIREDKPPTSNDDNSQLQKKKVVFADDRGMSLTQVRVMTEPSNVPPLWSLRFLSQVTKGLSAEPLPEPWEITFPQPASDYIEFRRKLDTQNVSLENVIVRESETCVIGTVKVKNIAYKKEVFVRSTSDSWTTHEDTFCTFALNTTHLGQPAAVYVLYDTFSFKLTLPPKSRRIEFCICFRCENKEYWDNNNNSNYVLVKKAPISPNFSKSLSSDNLLADKNQQPLKNNTNTDDNKATKYTDISQTKIDTWSEFASWTHLDTQGPYW